MGMLNERFPDNIARNAIGGPGFTTIVTTTPSGAEQRIQMQSRSRHRFNVSQGVKTPADQAVADAFFRKARGRTHTFRFRDPNDYRLTQAASRLVLVSGTTYQLCKVYGGDEPTFEEVRPLTRIVAGTLRVYSSGVLLDPGSYTANIETGRITTASTSLTAACEFDVPCRFDFDQKQARYLVLSARGMLVEWADIDIVEVFEVVE